MERQLELFETGRVSKTVDLSEIDRLRSYLTTIARRIKAGDRSMLRAYDAVRSANKSIKREIDDVESKRD